MTDASLTAADVLCLIRELGVTATLVSVTKVYDDGTGTSSETTVSHSITTSDLQDDARNYSPQLLDLGVEGTFWVASESLSATPKPGDRIVYLNRTFQVIRAAPYRWAGSLVAWELNVGEVGTA